jgi:hypothetical protein
MMDPKMTMEVPPQVREFAEKSVDQAEKAISSFIESATKSVATVPGPMTEEAQTGTCDHRSEPESTI